MNKLLPPTAIISPRSLVIFLTFYGTHTGSLFTNLIPYLAEKRCSPRWFHSFDVNDSVFLGGNKLLAWSIHAALSRMDFSQLNCTAGWLAGVFLLNMWEAESVG